MIAFTNPVLCIALITIHIIINAIINPKNPGKRKLKRKNINVIKKEVKNTRLNSVFLDLLKKPSAILRKMVIITSMIIYIAS
jgi:hypothetical protein